MSLSQIYHRIVKGNRVDVNWLANMQSIWAEPDIKSITAISVIIAGYYKQIPELMDVYSRLAYYLLSRDIFLKIALGLFKKDYAAHRQSWFMTLRYAECLAVCGQIRHANTIVQQTYGQYDNAVNGYAAIAWHLRKNKTLLRNPLAYAYKDITKGRISPGYILNVAEIAAIAGSENKATQLVSDAYKIDSGLSGGYIRVARQYHWPRKLYAHYIELTEYDLSRDTRSDKDKRLSSVEVIIKHYRTTPSWIVNTAEAYAACGDIDKALQLVEAVYRAHPHIIGGYTRCAKHCWQNNDYEQIIRLTEKERSASNCKSVKAVKHWTPTELSLLGSVLTPAWIVNFAEAYAACGLISQSFQMVEYAYKKDCTLNNCYFRCAWRHYWPQRNYKELLRCIKKDAEEERALTNKNVSESAQVPSPKWLLNQSVVYAANGKLRIASAKVAAAYAKDKKLKDGYAKLASILAEQGKHANALAYYKKDILLDRISGKSQLNYAALLAKTNAGHSAINEVAKAYKRQHNLVDGYVGIASQLPDDLPMERLLHIIRSDISRRRFTKQRVAHALGQARYRIWRDSACIEWALQYPNSKLNIKKQLSALENAAKHNAVCDRPFSVLNSELWLGNIKDAITQFNEIVLNSNYFFECAAKYPFIIDGGANIGMAITYFKWLYPNCRIIAFEPHPIHYAICKQNIQHNKWKDVNLLPYAIADKKCKMKFNMLEGNAMGSGITTRLAQSINTHKVDTIDVECHSLGKYLTRHIDFLKLDIECAEERAIRNADELINNVGIGFIEYHYDRETKDNSLSVILRHIEASGFSYHIEQAVSHSNSNFASVLHEKDQHNPGHWSICIRFAKRKTTGGT